MDVEEKFDVSTIVVDTGWDVISDPVMVSNTNEDYCKKSAGESKELGKGVCVGV